MEKKIISCVFMVLILFIMPQISIAQKVETSLIINGEYILLENPVITEAENQYIQTKDLASIMNFEVEWLAEIKQIKLFNEINQYLFEVDNRVCITSGASIEMDLAPWIEDDISYLPLKFISEEMGFEFNYNEDTYTVELTRKDFSLEDKYIDKAHYTDEELELLARIIQVESGSRSLEVKLAVANVVLNRVKSPRFPDTLSEVIYQSGQFPPTRKSNFKTLKINTNSYIAAKKALEGVNNIDECLFFNSRPFSGKSNDFYKKIEGEYFYR